MQNDIVMIIKNRHFGCLGILCDFKQPRLYCKIIKHSSQCEGFLSSIYVDKNEYLPYKGIVRLLFKD